jgi:MIOREX complex component 7
MWPFLRDQIWATTALLRSPAFHRAVRAAHARVHRLKHGVPPEEMGGTKIEHRWSGRGPWTSSDDGSDARREAHAGVLRAVPARAAGAGRVQGWAAEKIDIRVMRL